MARDNQSEFDVQTVDTNYRNFNVDDFLKSVVSVPDAKRLVRQLTDLLSKGGFHLTKWISNCREVLEFIPASERAPSVMTLDFEDLPIDRALGTQWNVEKDTLSFRVSEKEVADTRSGNIVLGFWCVRSARIRSPSFIADQDDPSRIVQARRLRVVGKCLKCRQWNARPCQQVMAPLSRAVHQLKS